MKKRIFAILLTAAVAFSLSGCSQKPEEENGLDVGPYFSDDDVIEDAGGVDERTLTDFQFTFENTTATDVYGRQILTCGDRIEGRDVGMFYFTWMGQHQGAQSGIYDISELLLNRPDDLYNAKGTKYSPAGKYHFWGEPLYGYYNSMDPWVMDRQVQMLTTMGVDFLGVDATNAYSYNDVYRLLFETLDKYQKQGFDVPKVAFLFYAESVKTLKEVYENFYREGAKYCYYPDLFYSPNGKPFVSADLRDFKESDQYLLDFFEVRQMQWPNEEMNDDAFSWMSFDWPQYNHNGDMNVSVAQHKTVQMSDTLGSWGRGYNVETNRNEKKYAEAGINMRSQWNTVFDSLGSDKPVDRVFVTGYNEWVAAKFPLNGTGGAVQFIDQFNEEFSRDIEPMKGGYGDNFYLLSMAMQRRYQFEKGKRYQLPQKTLKLSGNASEWDSVRKYMDFAGDTFERDYIGFHKSVRYTDDSNRNDIVSVQVTHDSSDLFVRILTTDSITPHADGDENWMNLWLGTGSGASFGDYNYVINRHPGADGKTSVERSKGGFDWETVGSADCVVGGNEMILRIPLSLIGMNANAPALKFKVSDNVLHPEDPMNFYLYGDSAPLGRLSYTYGV